MELRDYARLLRRRWRWVALLTLLCLGIAALLTAIATPLYRAKAQLFVSISGGDSVSDLAQGSSFTLRQVTTYADMVTAPVVLEPVIDELALDLSAEDLAADISTQVPPETVLIDIFVSGEDPAEIAELANAVATQFTRTVAELEQIDDSGPSPVKASVIRPAREPGSPVSPNPPRALALGLSLGLILGIGAALAREMLDTRVMTEDDVSRVTDRTIIGSIAFDKGAANRPLVVHLDRHSPRAEAFRALRTNLQFINAAEHPRSLVMTSSVPGEGKSTTSANLALTLAASGAQVCLIDGDLRRPRLLEYLGLEGSVGLTSVLIGQSELEDVLQPFTDNLTILGPGPIPPNPSELLGSPPMADLLQQLQTRFDYVVVDAPPLLPVTDAAVLSRLVDGTIVLVGAGTVHRDQLARSMGALENVGANVLGLVLNRVPVSEQDAYSYAYYRDEEPTPGERHGRGRRRRPGHAEQLARR